MQQDSILVTYGNDSLFQSGGVSETDTLTLQDSVMMNVPAGPEEVPSLLGSHQLEADQFVPGELHHANEDWITFHFIVALMVYAWIRLFYNKRLKQVFRSAVGIRFQGMMVREGNVLRERISIALMIIYLISTTLLVYLFFTRILNFELLHLKSFKLFSFLMLVVIFVWILKNLTNTIIGKVFQNPVILSEYLLTNFIFNIATGSILLPILILAVYLPSVEMIYVGLAVWIIAFFYRLIRLVVTSISYTKFSFFNRILYLCTFELTPVIVLTKLVMSNLS